MAGLIVMLTKDDKTVANACNLFNQIKTCPLHGVGFKDIGLRYTEMQKLATAIKKSGKKFYFEIVSTEDAEKSVQKGLKLGADAIMGGKFNDETLRILQKTKIEYYPYAGKFSERPCQLLGDIQQIIAEAKEITKKDVSGITLLAYRYPETQKLLENFINQINSNLIIAGNIDDTQKIKTMQQLPVQAFTIGTALINNEFPAKNNIRAQVEFVIKEMRKWGKR